MRLRSDTPFPTAFLYNAQLENAGYPVDWMEWVGAEGA